MSVGVELIRLERLRQQQVEGFTAATDAAWTEGQLQRAADAYVQAALELIQGGDLLVDPPAWFPWAPHWWKPSRDPKRNLVKAGALIAAELDRLHAIDPPPAPAAPGPAPVCGARGQWRKDPAARELYRMGVEIVVSCIAPLGHDGDHVASQR